MTKKFVGSVTAVGLMVGLLGGFYYVGRFAPAYQGKRVPSSGLVVNPAGRNPGNLDYAVQDFKRIYAAMTAHRSLHGKLPSIAELEDFSKPIAPGIQLTRDDFNTPDARFSDTYIPGAKTVSQYAFAYYRPRPDGTAKHPYPGKGEKDLWMECQDYTRENRVIYQGRHNQQNLTGVFVLLWSDGTIEKVPNGQEVWASDGPGSFARAFRGETGLPAKTQTIAQVTDTHGFNTLLIHGKPPTNR